jgi:hypothetical protein
MFTESPTRVAQLNVRVTSAERDLVARTASQIGLTVGQLVRRALAIELRRISESVSDGPQEKNRPRQSEQTRPEAVEKRSSLEECQE